MSSEPVAESQRCPPPKAVKKAISLCLGGLLLYVVFSGNERECSTESTASRSTFLGTIIKGIAMAENNNIRGFNWSHVYKVERSEKHGKTYWHVTETPHASDTQGFVRRGFPAKLEGEEGEITQSPVLKAASSRRRA
jgi:hypothetical protein